MRPLIRLAIAGLTTMSVLWSAVPASAAGCQFLLGFKTLHDLIPASVGNCVTDEQHGANGDSVQVTIGVNNAGGLLVWRKADNWTAYTDGYHTWLNGPSGLQQRLNTDRFPWEGDYGMVYTLTLGDLPPGFVVTSDLTGAVSNDQVIADANDPVGEAVRLKQTGRISGYEDEFWRDDSPFSTRAGHIRSGVNLYSSVAGAQADWVNEGWTATPDGWQQVSAPVVGDQSIAFTRPTVLESGNQKTNGTDYLIHFRVGSVLAWVRSGMAAPSVDLNGTVALAQVVANRIRTHG